MVYKKSNETIKLEKKIAYILETYKLNQEWFTIRSLIKTLIAGGHKYNKRTEYPKISKLIKSLYNKGCLETIPWKGRDKGIPGRKPAEWRVVNVERMKKQLDKIFERKFPPEKKKIKPPSPTPENIPPIQEDVSPTPETNKEDDSLEEEDFTFEIFELIADSAKNEFTCERIFDILYNDGYNITIQHVRKTIASLASQHIIRLKPGFHHIYNIIKYHEFFPMLDKLRRKEYAKPPPPPPVLDHIETGRCIVRYTNSVKKKFAKAKKDLEEANITLELYKEENNKLRERLEIVEKENVRLGLLVSKAGLDNPNHKNDVLDLSDLDS